MADLSWGGHNNGRIPLNEMRAVRGELFRTDAAIQMQKFEDAFKAVFGEEFRIGEGYRSLERQQTLRKAYLDYLAGKGPWAPIANYVGHSVHGWGLAADLWSGIDRFGTAQHDWAVKNGPRFGWWWGSTPSEAWHFEFNPGLIPAGSTGLTNLINLSEATVRKLQSDLKRLGYNVTVDGSYGPGTTKVVTAYQTANGLTTDGIAGTNTLKSIASAIKKLDAKEAAIAASAKLARESNPMFSLIKDNEPQSSGYLVTDRGIVGIGDVAEVKGRDVFELFRRLRDAQRNGTEEVFNKRQIQIMNQVFDSIP